MLGLLLAVCLALTVVPALSAPASEAAPVTTVNINGTTDELNADYPYLSIGYVRSATGTLGLDAVAQFNAATGTLTLQGYNSGYIFVVASQGAKDLTIKLIGANNITTVLGKGISHSGGGNITITSDDPTNSLNINVSSSNADVYGIVSNSPTVFGDIIIGGKAKVTVSVKETSTIGSTNARGLYGENIKVLDDASLTTAAETASSSGGSARGIVSRTLTTINTAGTVTLDASANVAGSYAFDGNLVLTNASKLTLKWNGSGTSHSSSYSLTYDASLFARELSDFVETYTDKVSPVISAISGTRTSDTAATIGFTTSEAGTAYYLVKESGATPAPTSTEVKNGTSLGAVTAGANADKNITLTAGAKDIYVVVMDAAGNISAPKGIGAPEFDNTAPSLSAGKVDRTSDTAATIGFTTSEAGTAHYLVQAKGTTAPSKESVVLRGTSLGAATVGANADIEITLTAGAKDIYVVVVDAVSNISETLKIEAAAWESPKNDSSDNSMAIIAAAVLALLVGGFIGYRFFLKKKTP